MKVGPVLAKDNTLQLQQLEYTNEHLLLTIASKNLDNITAFSKAISKQGLAVNQRDIKNHNDHVVAVLEVTLL